MEAAISAGREAKKRCYVCNSNRPESLMEPIKLSKDLVVQACKEHGLENRYEGDLG